MRYGFKAEAKAEILRDHLNLGGENDKGERIDVTSLYFERNGKPWIPVMGEFHFSRYNKKLWREELCKMKAGGITVVSTYLFWLYHEETRGEFDFTGDRDIREFVEICADTGLDVALRIGPWAHGECRNGGFPDWLMKEPYKLRDNNDGYLKQVRRWYGAIAEQVKGLYYKDGGNIIIIQLENELVHNAAHLAELKKIAIECGMIVPLYTVTGWNGVNGAEIPVDEVVPVFGGYCEAPWEQHTRPLPPSVHYFFNRMRNDTAIGADLIAQKAEDGWQLPYERYPFATCELGGGIQITHHRRPIISGMDIYAMALVKLGSGNNMQGYYMYHGGTNKIGKYSTFNETRASGYPNDYPILSYDFQAPLSEYGEIREQYRLLNMLHMFINDYGAALAKMWAVDADAAVKRDDTKALRYGLRTDGDGGFVFVNHYQRLTKLEDVRNAVIDTGKVTFPPIDVCGGISFFMPFRMAVGQMLLEYATVQPLCMENNTYFFAQVPGITPEYRFAGIEEAFKPAAGELSLFTLNGVNVVTLTWEQARYTRRLSGGIYIGNGCDLYEYGGKIRAAQAGGAGYMRWNGESFVSGHLSSPQEHADVQIFDVVQPPFEAKYLSELNIGGERQITWKKVVAGGSGGMAEIEYKGDAAQLYAGGELIADDYYYGKKWRVPARLIYGKECYMAVSELRDDFYREF